MPDDRWLPQLLGSAVLVAALVLLRSTFAPFATQGCIMCPDFFIIPSRSVFQGLDGWIVLDAVIGLTLSATFLLMNLRRATAAIATFTLALSVLALGIFERVDAGGRVIGWDGVSPPVQLGPHGPIPYVPAHELSPPVHMDYGSYLFLGAAVVAVIAATIIVVMNVRTHRDNRAPRRMRTAVREPVTDWTHTSSVQGD